MSSQNSTGLRSDQYKGNPPSLSHSFAGGSATSSTPRMSFLSSALTCGSDPHATWGTPW